MNKTSILNGILIGLIVVLAGVILLHDGSNNPAGAAVVAGNPGSADTPRGTGMGANGVIAVTGQYSNDASVLYLIDTNREVILTYACYTRNRGTTNAFADPIFDFLNGRSYAWDAAYCQKGDVWGETKRARPLDVRTRTKTDKDTSKD